MYKYVIIRCTAILYPMITIRAYNMQEPIYYVNRMQVISYNIPTSDTRVYTFLIKPAALRCKRNSDRGRGIWSTYN